MVVSDKLKKVIFKKLYEDLSHVEIIPYENSIWFIDRENKYWYFEYTKTGDLWWRYFFFLEYFSFFSIENQDDFTPILSEWVEEVLNCKVLATRRGWGKNGASVEEVLNCKVVTTGTHLFQLQKLVEEVLNCKVVTTVHLIGNQKKLVEEILNS